MAQYAYPDADVSTGIWGTAPLWSKLDEVSPNDSDSITASVRASTANGEVRLGDVTDPESSSDHVLHVRYWRTTNGTWTVNLTVTLWQGDTPIAQRVVSGIASLSRNRCTHAA